MSFDSLALHLVTHELHDTILGGTIRHIEQIEPHSIFLKITRGAETFNLLISAHSVHARTHLIKRPPKGQARSHFADFLMKHIMRGKIVSVEQVGWDRVLKLTVEPKSELLEISPKSMIAEFMGKHSNLILIDEDTGRILESIKHIDETMSRYREVLPGVTYTPPPQQDKLHPLTLDAVTFVSLVEGRAEIGWRFLFNRIDGLSPMLAKEIIVRAGDSPTPNRLWEAYQQVVAHFPPARSQPQVLIESAGSVPHRPPEANDHSQLSESDKIVAVSALKLHQFPRTDSRRFETMSDALCAYYDVIAHQAAIQSERNGLSQVL
ncbi:MAG: NFACT family protein, partial [Candidatus Poribacteria bacterium]|nr:NFACT family protein [Candidatus Poribacteria bacterium]